MIFNLFCLVLALVGWYFFSFRVLRYMVDASEGRWRWELAVFLLLLCAAIFLIKFALFGLTHFPEPGSWASKLFLGCGLICSYLVPFATEYIKHFFRRS
jgi:hypothetical protein